MNLNWLMPLGLISNAVSNLVGTFKREATAKENLAIVKEKQQLDKTMTEIKWEHDKRLEEMKAYTQIGIAQKHIENQQRLEQQRAETNIKLALIQAKNQQELQERSFEFQTWLKQQEWAENRALTEYVQKIQLQIANNNLDFQKWKVGEEKEVALTLKRLDGEITLARGAMERETQLMLMNERYERDHNPLWLTRRQFLSDAEIESLRLFLSPISPELMGKLPGIKNNVETKLTKIAEYYSSQGRALRFFGDAWTNIKDAQEATAQALFADYKTQPILILNAQMEGEYFYLKYNFWGSNWQTFRSGVLIDQLSLKEQQYLYAKREVQKWQKLRQESSNPNKIDLLYGANNTQRLSTNLEIMETEIEAIELGLDTDHFHYNLSEKEVKQSADYLVLLHALNTGLWADIYFLLYAPTTQPLPPLLLNCLQDLELINPKHYSKEEIAELIGNLAKSYNEILQILASRGQGVLIADLHLQMSESCFKLKLYELAKEQVILSVSNWLTHRNVNPTEDLNNLLQLMKPLITSGDRPYITALQEILHKLGVNSYLDDILPFLNLLAEQEEKRHREEVEAKRKAEEAKRQREIEAQRQREAEAKRKAEEEKKRRLKEDLGNGVILELVEIPAGSFMMGSNDDVFDGQPIHQVNINYSFLMGKYPITQAQYQAIMGNNPSHFKNPVAPLAKGGWGDRPVEKVSWDNAQEFCQKLSAKTGRAFRLPSEAEWEYACRAGTNTKYFFGNNDNDLDKYAYFSNNSSSETHPVGGKNPNPWQLYDILGNVWEWCEDDWQDNYNGVPCDGSSKKSNSNTKVLRGGSWSFDSLYCRCAFRDGISRDGFVNVIGFRVVLAL